LVCGSTARTKTELGILQLRLNYVAASFLMALVTKVFFKVSLWWPQGNFKRPLGGIWHRSPLMWSQVTIFWETVLVPQNTLKKHCLAHTFPGRLKS